MIFTRVFVQAGVQLVVGCGFGINYLTWFWVDGCVEFEGVSGGFNCNWWIDDVGLIRFYW